MRVLLKLLLDCEPDAAWRALQSPTVFREVSLPWANFTSLEPEGFPTVWSAGAHPVKVRALRAVTVGEQEIDISFPGSASPGVRILRDTGGGRTGLLKSLPHLDHRMAVADAPGGPSPDGTIRTLYRDQLIVKAGAITPAVWYSLWAFWQWRGLRLRQLAPTWAYDPETE